MKKSSKAAALLLAAAMAASLLTACRKENNASVTTASGETQTSAESLAESKTADAEKAQISMMTVDHTGTSLKNQGSAEIIAAYEEYTNTVVDWNWVAADSYDDVMGITLMDKQNMPMIITVNSVTMTPVIIQAAKNDAFWDLNEFIWDAQKYPNLSQMNKEVNKAYTLDGKLIGLYRARPIGRKGLGYRTDWAERLGIEEPKTVEDVYNMAYQFTYGDPDGNGKDDTYGFAMCKYTGPIDIVEAWFGAGNGWAERDGRLVPVHMTDEYMEAVDWFKKMYDEGLIYEDWAVRDTNSWKDNVRNGECGIFLDVLDNSRGIWDYFVDNSVPSVADPGQPAGMTLVGGIARDENSGPVTQATAGSGGFYVITKAAAKTEADVEACLTFLDKMNDEEMLLLADHGLEGRDWVYDADGLVVDQLEGLEASQKPFCGLNQCLTYVPGSGNLPLKKSERLKIEEAIKLANEDIAVFNPALGYLANSATYSNAGGDLDDIIESARTQYICGTIDLDEFKAQMDLWLQRGGQEVIDEVNAQYQADK